MLSLLTVLLWCDRHQGFHHAYPLLNHDQLLLINWLVWLKIQQGFKYQWSHSMDERSGDCGVRMLVDWRHRLNTLKTYLKWTRTSLYNMSPLDYISQVKCFILPIDMQQCYMRYTTCFWRDGREESIAYQAPPFLNFNSTSRREPANHTLSIACPFFNWQWHSSDGMTDFPESVKGPTDKKWALIQAMACPLYRDKPSTTPMLTQSTGASPSLKEWTYPFSTYSTVLGHPCLFEDLRAWFQYVWHKDDVLGRRDDEDGDCEEQNGLVQRRPRILLRSRSSWNNAIFNPLHSVFFLRVSAAMVLT